MSLCELLCESELVHELLTRTSEILQIDSGLKDELVLGDPKSPRYVLWGGRLRPVPAGNLLAHGRP